eukprot:2519725-Pleurochrysis_carterae.AAC.1
MAQALGGAAHYFNRKPHSGSIFRLEVPCAISHEPLPSVGSQQPCARTSEPSSLDYRCSAATASTATRQTGTRASEARTANRLSGTHTTKTKAPEAGVASPSTADAVADTDRSTLARASTVPTIALAA